MKATTEQIVSALRVLSVDIQSEDGVANAVVAEAAERLTLMANLVARHVKETKEDTEQMAVASETMVEATAKIQSLRDRIKRLEEAGDALEYASVVLEAGEDPNGFEKLLIAQREWHRAKEAKP